MVPNARSGVMLGGLAVVLLALAFAVPAVQAEDAAPMAFDSPEAAAKALFDAAAKNDDTALKALLGTESEDLVPDGSDPVVARNRAEFVKAAAERLEYERAENGHVILAIGHNDWPFPVPLVQKDGKWSFDAEAGREEILARRIGRNELEAIELLKGYIAAQVEYAAADRDGDEVREYAQKIMSSEGKKDGLYWPTAEGSDEDMSPMGPLVVSLEEYVHAKTPGDKPSPFHGYYWKILKAQGPNAPGGAHDYVINGNMIAGFALVGVPAEYMNSGVMTFVVSHHGKMLQKDLGENSLEVAKAMASYDPDDTWTEVGED